MPVFGIGKDSSNGPNNSDPNYTPRSAQEEFGFPRGYAGSPPREMEQPKVSTDPSGKTLEGVGPFGGSLRKQPLFGFPEEGNLSEAGDKPLRN